jgi:DNA polymerase (family 10)
VAGEKPKLDRFGVAAGLQEIAQLMDLKGGQYRFKAKAYNAGARAIQAVGDLDRLVREDRLTTLPRIGAALASQIKQLYLTGESAVLNELRQEFPKGIAELSAVPGLSVEKIRQLHDALGITSVAELKAAAEAGQLQKLKGFGPKTEQRLLAQLANPVKKTKQRLHLHHAWSAADQAVEYLKTLDGVVDVAVAGSLRRWEETIGVVEIVASAQKPAELIQKFLQSPLILSSQLDGPNSCVAQFADGAPVALTAVLAKEFSIVLFVKTGSEAHAERLLDYAQRNQVRLPQSARTEEQIYKGLGMQYIPPELRENAGEIEAAAKGKLPQDLVTVADIKGMVHCHTTYSDGVHTLEQMVRGAEGMGMKYITITDHSPTAIYANGLKLDRLQRQWDEIDELQEQVSIFSAAGYRLRFHQLLSTPLLFAAMSILAAAFSLRLTRLGGLAGLAGVGVALGFVVFFFNQFAGALAKADIIPLFAAAWAPAVVALLAGVTLLCYTEDG